MTPTQHLPDLAIAAAPDLYDLAAILERLLSAVLRDDRSAAHAAFEIFEKLEPTPALRQRLHGLVEGRIRLLREEDVYFVGPPAGLALEPVAQCIRVALNTLASLLGQPSPLVWVDIRGHSDAANITYRELPGVRRICFASSLFAGPDWQSVVWHECAHAVLMAGCRFLDEGWAVWCQYQFTTTTQYPVPVDQLAELALSEDIAGIPLQGLLRGNSSDLTFRLHVRNEQEQREIYVRACRFFDALQKRAGIEAVARAFERIWRGADASTVLNALCDGSVATLEPGCAPSMGGVDRAFRALRIQSRQGAAEPFLGIVRAHLREHPDDAYGVHLQARLLGHAFVSTFWPQSSVEALAAQVDQAIARLHAIDAEDPGARILLALKNIRAGLIAEAQDDMAQVVGEMTAAERHLLEAEVIAPEDGDVRLSRARFEMWRAKPDRAAALEHLAVAARDPSCTEEALVLAGELSALSPHGSVHGRSGAAG